MNLEHYKMAQGFAIEYGTILGLSWLITFAFMIAGMCTNGLLYLSMGLFGLGVTAVLPFYLAWRFKQHLDVGEQVSFFIAWLLAMLMFLYACIFAGVGEFVYFTYMDHGRLMQVFHDVLFAPEVEAQYRAAGAADMLDMARMQFDMMRNMTPMQLTLILFENNLFLSLFMSLPVAIVARLKATDIFRKQ